MIYHAGCVSKIACAVETLLLFVNLVQIPGVTVIDIWSSRKFTEE